MHTLEVPVKVEQRAETETKGIEFADNMTLVCRKKTRNMRKRLAKEGEENVPKVMIEKPKNVPKVMIEKPNRYWWNRVGATGGRFGALADEAEEVDICAVEPQPEDEITVDSGAGKCVWPRTRKEGGEPEKLAKGVRLMAASGQEMKVDGEKVVKFQAGDQMRCGLKFLVTDVKKPLAAVSAIVDGGNVCVFGPGPWGSFIQNIATGERIFMERKKGTYVIKVKFTNAADKEQEVPKWKPKKGQKVAFDDGGQRAMDIGAAEKETEDEEEEVAHDAIFRRRT